MWVLVPGEGVTRHMTGYAPVSKKSVERLCFSDIGVVDVFLKKGAFLILHHTLGVPISKNVRHIIQNDILGYHFQF